MVVFATLFGISLTRVAPHHRKPVLGFFEAVAQVMFKYTDIIMRLTPLGVFGAMAYNVSHMAAGKEIDGVWREGWHAVGYLLGKYATLEQAIRRHPEQYLWMHQRFKTQPDGRRKLYKAAAE